MSDPQRPEDPTVENEEFDRSQEPVSVDEAPEVTFGFDIIEPAPQLTGGSYRFDERD